MAEDNLTDPGPATQRSDDLPRQSTGDSDWGEDWESAFQAEEYQFSEEEGEALISADGEDLEEGGARAGEAVKAAGHDEFSTLAVLDEEEAAALTNETARARTARAPGPAKEIGEFKARLFALPLGAWIGITATLALLLAATLLYNSMQSGRQPATTPKGRQSSAALNQPSPPAAILPQTGAPPHPTATPAPTAPTTSIPPATENPVPAATTRQDWDLEPFIVPVMGKGSKEVTFVTIRLSLVTVLPAGTVLTEEKKIKVRDSIFQFFSNRPLDELRRYLLARGDMERNLLDWLRKQWPDGGIAAVVFHTYQLD